MLQFKHSVTPKTRSLMCLSVYLCEKHYPIISPPIHKIKKIKKKKSKIWRGQSRQFNPFRRNGTPSRVCPLHSLSLLSLPDYKYLISIRNWPTRREREREISSEGGGSRPSPPRPPPRGNLSSISFPFDPSPLCCVDLDRFASNRSLLQLLGFDL